MTDPHDRRCFRCGHIQHCIDRVIPEVTCRECGSNDTRAVVPLKHSIHCTAYGGVGVPFDDERCDCWATSIVGRTVTE